jgi:hypothetical protein
MWQFAESVRGLADGCLEMGLPVTGGNVSFYNQTGSVAILPTPVIGVLGVIQDVRTRTPLSFNKAGLDLYLVGETHEDLAGSEWAFLHNQRIGQAPTADLQRELRLIELLLEGKDVTKLSVQDRIKAGMGLVPEDRQRDGLIQQMSVGSNLSLASYMSHIKRGFVNRATEKNKIDEFHLELQNLLYEISYYKKEINKCHEFRSLDEEISLVPVDEFYSKCPIEISKPVSLYLYLKKKL